MQNGLFDICGWGTKPSFNTYSQQMHILPWHSMSALLWVHLGDDWWHFTLRFRLPSPGEKVLNPSWHFLKIQYVALSHLLKSSYAAQTALHCWYVKPLRVLVWFQTLLCACWWVAKGHDKILISDNMGMRMGWHSCSVTHTVCFT